MAMSLNTYFKKLIARVEDSDEITNGRKDKDGFYKPTRTIVLRHLHLLQDLHKKSFAKPMLRAAWDAVVEELPPDWLVLTAQEKIEMKKMLE